MTSQCIAGIEAGGTKIICAVADADGKVLDQARIATRDPDPTFAEIAHFFGEQGQRHGPISAGGVASFGPLDLDRGSPGYGALMVTPKPGWSQVDMRGRIAEILQAPVAIDTDVNCAGLAEISQGAARGMNRICYITVGTGIGVGIIENGLTNAGAGHPEVGHIRVARAPGDDFAGICPSHGDCLEGMACGPAMQGRWGMSAEDLPPGHVGWAYEAHYIASLCINLTYIVRPQRIIIGGGVMERASLIAAVRGGYRSMLADYALDRYCADVSTFLCAPLLHTPSPGLIGAISLARMALAAPAAS